jgi:Fur family transcriptional regulator, peroxide stress response regulator
MTERVHPELNKEERVADMVSALRRGGLRLTPQREAVCWELAGDESHPTAQALYDRLKPRFSSLSLATVYNTLQILVEQGLIHELGSAGDGTVHYDADPFPHVNLVCIRCHRIEDLAQPGLQAIAREIDRTSGYRVQGARIVFYGVCQQCQSLEPAEN